LFSLIEVLIKKLIDKIYKKSQHSKQQKDHFGIQKGFYFFLIILNEVARQDICTL